VRALNYNHLRYFWAVAREGNLTRTAEKLRVSQSALSIQIRKLETQLGHDLFERSGRQLRLTEAGRIAFDHAETIFAGGAELLATLKDRPEDRRSILRVGALATLSRNFQIGFLLVNVAPQRDAATPWISHPIAEQPVSLIGTPARIGEGGPLARLLAREPLVLPTMESSVRIGFDALIDRMGLRVRIAAEVDDMAMMRLLAREDLGLAVVPPIVVKDELASGRLVEVEQLPHLSETFFAVTMKRRFPNPLLRPLIAPREAGALIE
jgi:LysR family transcriptional activator of nhaA